MIRGDVVTTWRFDALKQTARVLSARGDSLPARIGCTALTEPETKTETRPGGRRLRWGCCCSGLGVGSS